MRQELLSLDRAVQGLALELTIRVRIHDAVLEVVLQGCHAMPACNVALAACMCALTRCCMVWEAGCCFFKHLRLGIDCPPQLAYRPAAQTHPPAVNACGTATCFGCSIFLGGCHRPQPPRYGAAAHPDS